MNRLRRVVIAYSALRQAMSPRADFSSRHPFAPPALPGFLALMGASDFRRPLAASSLVIACRRLRLSLRASRRISLVATPSRCETRCALRPRDVRLRSPTRADDCCLLALRHHRPSPTLGFSGLSAFTVSFTCYHCTSSPFVPTHRRARCRFPPQGSIPGPWLTATWVGFAPTR